MRTGGPNEDEDDMTWPAWAGVLPFARTPFGAGDERGVQRSPTCLCAGVADCMR